MRSEYTEAHSETDMPSYRLLPEQEVKKPYSPGLWQGTVRNRKVFERKTLGTKERKKITSSQEMVKRRENRHVQHAENIRSARPRATKKQRRRVIRGESRTEPHADSLQSDKTAHARPIGRFAPPPGGTSSLEKWGNPPY